MVRGEVALCHSRRRRWGLLYSTWYLAFYVLCMFRPFTGMMLLAAIVMLPMSIVVLRIPKLPVECRSGHLA
ncbi:hypothetical protein AGR7B_pAt0099 [Agrobacterium deltaense RV3]|nr:hypothetical protein AGR7B_pAt0099 [Agrobacterium deltaense RV3]